jgi:hypothetical protein
MIPYIPGEFKPPARCGMRETLGGWGSRDAKMTVGVLLEMVLIFTEFKSLFPTL